MKLPSLLGLCFVAAASSFAVVRPCRRRGVNSALASSVGSEDDGLILNDIDSQMAKLRSKYPTSEADYLALARARNAAKAASVNEGANDSDWHQVASEARQRQGAIDDWESAAQEAGNVDSQILIPMELMGDDSSTADGGDQDEPRLMLF